MQWIPFKHQDQIEEIKTQSQQVACLIFKHSTTCPISEMAKMRLEYAWDIQQEQAVAYYLDILNARDLSASIADAFSVVHQSPQILLIKNGACIFDASRFDIDLEEVKAIL